MCFFVFAVAFVVAGVVNVDFVDFVTFAFDINDTAVHVSFVGFVPAVAGIDAVTDDAGLIIVGSFLASNKKLNTAD